MQVRPYISSGALAWATQQAIAQGLERDEFLALLIEDAYEKSTSKSTENPLRGDKSLRDAWALAATFRFLERYWIGDHRSAQEALRKEGFGVYASGPETWARRTDVGRIKEIDPERLRELIDMRGPDFARLYAPTLALVSQALEVALELGDELIGSKSKKPLTQAIHDRLLPLPKGQGGGDVQRVGHLISTIATIVRFTTLPSDLADSLKNATSNRSTIE